MTIRESPSSKFIALATPPLSNLGGSGDIVSV